MNKALAAKLKLNADQNVLVKNAPTELVSLFHDHQHTGTRGKKYDAIVLFATTQAELNKHITTTLAALQNDALLWIAYPKKSGTLKTDMSRDYGWDALTEAGYIPVSLIAIDQTWSALRFRKEANVPKITRQPRPTTKAPSTAPGERILEIPEELKALLARNTKAKKFFDSLSYTNRKEYAVWISTAKKPETKLKRLSDTLDKLLKGLKNPSAKD